MHKKYAIFPATQPHRNLYVKLASQVQLSMIQNRLANLDACLLRSASPSCLHAKLDRLVGAGFITSRLVNEVYGRHDRVQRLTLSRPHTLPPLLAHRTPCPPLLARHTLPPLFAHISRQFSSSSKRSVPRANPQAFTSATCCISRRVSSSCSLPSWACR